MIFPGHAHSKFIQVPTLDTGGLKITWMLPEKCDYNSYEAQEVNYKPDTGMFWGGGEAMCTQTQAGYECHAEKHPGMHNDTQLIIQAHAYGCVSGNYYISEPVPGSF